MPVTVGKDQTGCWAQWGTTGKKYAFDCGDEKAMAAAKQKAYIQGYAATGGAMKENAMEAFDPPEASAAPAGVKAILNRVYNGCRAEWAAAHPDDKENEESKASCSKVAWDAVKQAGWKRAEDKWQKEHVNMEDFFVTLGDVARVKMEGRKSRESELAENVVRAHRRLIVEGGAGSGNFGHSGGEGGPGNPGGSSGGGSGGGKSNAYYAKRLGKYAGTSASDDAARKRFRDLSSEKLNPQSNQKKKLPASIITKSGIKKYYSKGLGKYVTVPNSSDNDWNMRKQFQTSYSKNLKRNVVIPKD